MIVQDTTALLSIVSADKGHAKALAALSESFVSSVSYSEFFELLLTKGLNAELICQQFKNLGLRVSAYDELQAILTAEFYEKTKSYGLSLSDRSCLALATMHNAKVYTCNASWKNLAVPNVNIIILK